MKLLQPVEQISYNLASYAKDSVQFEETPSQRDSVAKMVAGRIKTDARLQHLANQISINTHQSDGKQFITVEKQSFNADSELSQNEIKTVITLLTQVLANREIDSSTEGISIINGVDRLLEMVERAKQLRSGSIKAQAAFYKVS